MGDLSLLADGVPVEVEPAAGTGSRASARGQPGRGLLGGVEATGAVGECPERI